MLSFEWTLLVTLLTIGIVSGLSAARDGIIDELGDAAQAMVALDQAFTTGERTPEGYHLIRSGIEPVIFAIRPSDELQPVSFD